MDFMITPIDWILIIAILILFVLILILFKKIKDLSTGSGGGDCCDQVRKWAPKQDAWIKAAVKQFEEDRDWLKKLKNAVCIHHDYLVARKKKEDGHDVQIPDLGVLGYCGGSDPIDPPPPPCDWGTCTE